MKKRRKRKSIVDFRASFPDEESAIRYYESVRWANGVVSPFDETSKVTNARTVNISARIPGSTSLIGLVRFSLTLS